MLALAVGCDVQYRFTAVYAVSLAKRGFTSPRGLFEGPKGMSKSSPNRSRWIGRIGARCRKALVLGSPLTRA